MSASSPAAEGLPQRAARRQLRGRTQLRRLAAYAALTVAAVILLLPFVWMLSLSLKTPEQIGQYPPRLIPNPLTFANYPEALLRQQPFPLYLRNTVIIAAAVIVGDILSASFVAYGFARLRFPGREWLFTLLLSTMMVPLIVKLVPLFVLFKQLGWLNTFLPLVVPAFLGTPFFIFLMRQFYLTIPNELNEAARIDGANELAIWWRIYLPLSKPALATVAILAFQGVWNDFLGPLVFLQRQEVKTVTLGLYSLLGMFLEYHTVTAGAVAVILPMVLVFLFFQRYFVQGIAVSGLKG